MSFLILSIRGSSEYGIDIHVCVWVRERWKDRRRQSRESEMAWWRVDERSDWSNISRRLDLERLLFVCSATTPSPLRSSPPLPSLEDGKPTQGSSTGRLSRKNSIFEGDEFQISSILSYQVLHVLQWSRSRPFVAGPTVLTVSGYEWVTYKLYEREEDRLLSDNNRVALEFKVTVYFISFLLLGYERPHAHTTLHADPPYL